MNMKFILTSLFLTTLLSSIGAISLKKAMNDLPVLSVRNLFFNKWIYIGLILYIASAIENIVLLKFLDYSIAFPMTSLAYVWTVLISHDTFKESLNTKKIIAIFMIIYGVFIINTP
ncbi:conserved membrane hypothetical protein [Carnobacterium maltaromaticum]|uniref:multidrug transporter n=1 Tax=Carnobacterium maltaromaticum TaxID=2751 RepID=UPI0019EE725B|nr:multidrug transporter [Carnobacterium maltaromaticum]CAD5900472.1 conserved membrane hypothetical protein [Carnobacterium maltaromaticum]